MARSSWIASNACSGELGCWGKAASWCDCSGFIQGKEYGITILDDPENPRFPTRWHVRAYGLLSANPFGLSAFDKAKPGTGSLTIEPGDMVSFRHVVIVHRGPPSAAAIMRRVEAPE